MAPNPDFPPAEFDAWAATYDEDVVRADAFPFAGYRDALDTVVRLAAAEKGMSVLDLGTGTGNLALRFVDPGCDLWCTDFSEAMLAQARQKLPAARFFRHDLASDWPTELQRRFDRIVSAYVFHHFELNVKIGLVKELVERRLAPAGRLILADISFPDQNVMREYARAAADQWEVEPYWQADEASRELTDLGLEVEYVQVSDCAGVYRIENPRDIRPQD